MKQPIERFWNFVDLSDGGPCWTWTGNACADGYGWLKVNNKNKATHRFSYEYFNKISIPYGMCVCHKCDNPPCVNPQHLFLATKGGNNKDRHNKGRDATGDKSGLRLHPECIKRGQDRRNTILNEDKVKQIRELKKHGATLRGLAHLFGVSHHTIMAIVHGKIWKHVGL